MNLYIFVSSALLLLGSINALNLPANYSIIHVKQKADHFGYFSNLTFDQRVIISNDYSDDINDPVFFYCGNEGNIMVFAQNTGFMWENAKKMGAKIIFAEHRYYGTSFPPNTTEGVQTYSFLSVEQALADFAYLIEHLRNQGVFSANAPILSFGGSYGGMLAAWFRMKYPHLTVGALAASAPVNQFVDHYNCSAFNRIVTKDFAGYSPNCATAIQRSWPAIRRLSKTSNGLQKVSNMFGLCNTLKNEEDVSHLIEYLGDALTNMAMTDYPNPSSFLKPMPAYPIEKLCESIYNIKVDDEELLVQVIKGLSIYFNYTGNLNCIDISTDSTELDAQAWGFQFCTELFLPVCSNGGNWDFFEPSKLDLDKFSDDCKKQFGVPTEFHKMDWFLGINKLDDASKIIFSNGDRDPWSAGGVLHLRNEKPLTHYKLFSVDYDLPEMKGKLKISNNDLIIIDIPNACHHEDLRYSESLDPPLLYFVRKYELKILAVWAHEHYLKNGRSPADWQSRIENIMHL